MEVRDAVEADADMMAAVADAPTDAMRGLVHDRTVRVAVADGGDGGSGAAGETTDAGEATDASEASDAGEASDGDRPDGSDSATDDDRTTDAEMGDTDRARDTDALLAFVSYDAGRDAVHVTQLAGEPSALDRLLDEPIGFASREGMAVELVVPDDETATRDAAERAGFEAVGPGPSFAGQETTTFRLEPARTP